MELRISELFASVVLTFILEMMNSEESAVQDFLSILEEHRKNCERQGKYVEAEIAKNRLEELRVHEENRRREAMRSRQIAERLGVEEAHMLEFQQFNLMWDKRMQDFEDNSQEQLKNLKRRHKEELADWQKQVISKAQRKVKFSKDLLNLRSIEKTLAAQKQYQQAALMKMRADNLEAWELEKLGNRKQKDLSGKEQRFKLRQKNELEALKQRIQTGKDEQKKQRQLDLEKVLRRYQNVKSELEAQQKLERMRMEKYSGQSLATMGSQQLIKSKLSKRPRK